MTITTRSNIPFNGRIRELDPSTPGYRIPAPFGAASLREIGRRLDQAYMGDRLFIISADLYNPKERVWYEKPAGIEDDGSVLADGRTSVHRLVSNPVELAREFLGEKFKGSVEYKDESGVVGVYLLRTEKDSELVVGIARKPRTSLGEGAKIGIGYIDLENTGGGGW